MIPFQFVNPRFAESTYNSMSQIREFDTVLRKRYQIYHVVTSDIDNGGGGD